MLISEEYRKQNKQLHESGERFGHRGHRHIDTIEDLMQQFGCKDVLDYGCGKATLSKHATFPVTNYDPAIERYAIEPTPCDLVVCTDVLEHIEPELIDNVLSHIRSKMLKSGYFVINTREDRSKTLPDGTNPHKIIQGKSWWDRKISDHFEIQSSTQINHNLEIIVT